MSFVEHAISKLRQDGRALTSDASSGSVANMHGAIQSDIDKVEFASLLASKPVVELSNRRLSEAGILPPHADERGFRAEYRAIKRRLLVPCSQADTTLPNASVIMVASASPGEGKTFTSFNLAASLAGEKDWTTILVDADFARGHLTSSMGLSGKPGILDVLSNRSRPVIDVVYRTSMNGLLFIPAGVSSENATELIASDRMKQVVRELLEAHPRTLIVFDSSPILPTSESRALADVAGQIVLVIKAESTLRPDVEAAVKILGERHNIGVVLNQYQGAGPQADYYGNSADRADFDAQAGH